nr:vitamin B12-dependent ribonucleotide reductase [Dehalococcoides sp.]
MVNHVSGKKPTPVNRNRVARAMFVAAASMGISDRVQIETLISQLIKRLGKPVGLPGMEDLLPSDLKAPAVLATDDEIDIMVKEVLDAGNKDKQNQIETQAKEEEPMPVKVQVKSEMKADARTEGLKLTDNAMCVLERRYLKKDKQGKTTETVEDMFRRVARTIAMGELIYNPKADVRSREDEFFNLMTRLEFLPNSPTLMNAGRELGQLSACFVLPVDDSIESIFDAVKHTAMIHKSGGGTGFSFSRLRPEQDRVGTTGGVASGPVSFMRAFDVATDVIKQGGTRRGANMAILSIDHPDIMKFVHAKDKAGVLTNFNLSVAITDKFMQAVKDGVDYDLLNPHNGEVVSSLNASEVFNKIVHMAWKTGDPGIVFIDRINAYNPTPQLGRIESTNPCGEQPLLPYESCNLGSINLSRMVTVSGGQNTVDYKKLSRVIKSAVRFLDNVIDVNKFPLPQIDEMTKKSRKIGLGVMGFADMLLELGVPYNSENSIKLAEEIMCFVNDEAHKFSSELAVERGVFPAYRGSIYEKSGRPMRNASCTTIAPTGTLSIIAGCSSGIEPHFALCFTRNILDGTKMIEVNPYFERAAKEGGYYSEELIKSLAEGAHLDEVDVPQDAKDLFVTAHQIVPEWHVRIQAAFQKCTDNAVSKTVNFSRDAGECDVAEVYKMAHARNLKGITIYRDGSREDQPMSTGKAENKIETPAVAVNPNLMPRKRSKVTQGITERVTTGCGYIYVTVNSDEHGICEVFSSLGKAGGCASAQLESTCRLISLALRSGMEVASVVKQLRGIRCPSIAWDDSKAVLSCADAIASVLEKHVNGYSQPVAASAKTGSVSGLVRNIAGQCPECGSILVYQEGCFICPGCGYTKC